MDRDSGIYVAGHTGLAGSAIVRKLENDGFANIVTRTHSELDLTEQSAVQSFFDDERPEYVINAAGRVGGIKANSEKAADFIRDNILMQTYLIENSCRTGVKKLCFLGSSCIYPRMAPQPIPESALMSGPLEPTNSAYAVAKIAGIEMCRAYRRQYGLNAICLMPTNLYGPNDNFDTETSHALPAMIRKFVDAANEGAGSVTLWGTGSPRREFMHADDLASAVVFLMDNYELAEIINVGTGKDISIRELAELIKEITDYHGKLEWDEAMPDGTPQKLLDVSKIGELGWQASILLREGIENTVRWFERSLEE